MNPIAEALDLVFPESVAMTAAAAVIFVVTFVVLYALGRSLVLPLVRRILHAKEVEDHARIPLMRIAGAVVAFLSLVIALGLAGLEGILIAFTGIAAAGTLAVGIAMQDVIRNFVAGVFIYIDEPFRIGDWIEWEDRSGVVTDIRLRTSRVRTFDNELLTVPNADLTENVVKNPVAFDRIRQRFTVGIGFEDDIAAAIEYMIEEADAHPDILADPEPSVRLTELGDSAVLLESRVWIAEPSRADFVRIRGEYGANVKRRFDAEGIDIPFPIRTLDGAVTLAAESDEISA